MAALDPHRDVRILAEAVIARHSASASWKEKEGSGRFRIAMETPPRG